MVRCGFTVRAKITHPKIMFNIDRVRTPRIVRAAAFTFQVSTDFRCGRWNSGAPRRAAQPGTADRLSSDCVICKADRLFSASVKCRAEIAVSVPP